ncbi:MAG: hypothetical protein ACYDCK_09430 [Thermoplasmatota archaeon]
MTCVAILVNPLALATHEPAHTVVVGDFSGASFSNAQWACDYPRGSENLVTVTLIPAGGAYVDFAPLGKGRCVSCDAICSEETSCGELLAAALATRSSWTGDWTHGFHLAGTEIDGSIGPFGDGSAIDFELNAGPAAFDPTCALTGSFGALATG